MRRVTDVASALRAIDAALREVEEGPARGVPQHLRDSSYGGAKTLGVIFDLDGGTWGLVITAGIVLVYTILGGEIAYEVPLEIYPDTYNGKPLMYAALASQKNHMAVYLSGVWGIEGAEPVFKARYLESGKRLDMGKSCVRFRSIDQLPVELIGEAVAKVSMEDFLDSYQRVKG